MSFPDYTLPNAEKEVLKSVKDDPNALFDHVMTFGTFDLFHPGHIFYLTESQKIAKEMMIIIARDARVTQQKGRAPIDDENTRQKNVQKAFPDARVVLGDPDDIFAPIRLYEPDVLAFGYDQRVPESTITEMFPHLSLIRLGGHETERYKSSILRTQKKP